MSSGNLRVAFGSFSHLPRQDSVGANYVGRALVDNGASVQELPQTFPLVDLHVSAQNLKDLDVITKSDPMCVLYISEGGGWKEFARTEVVWNNLNPTWVKFFRVMHVFEIKQAIRFRVYDVDNESARLSDQDFIGEVETDIASIVSSPGTVELSLHLPGRRDGRGKLNVTHEQVQNCASIVSGRLTGLELKKAHWIAGNDPFFTIAKASEGGKWLPILQSEVTRTMRWKKFKIPLQILCNLDPVRPLRITFFDFRKNSPAVAIGHFETNFTALSEQVGQTAVVKDEKGHAVGRFRVDELSTEQRYSFYDYLRNGTQLNLITAIDFTASNGNPNDPRSLHFFSPQAMNSYEQCIRAVGEILCQYDTDQKFPVLGFGGVIQGAVNHCFSLTFNPQAPEVQGLDGILGAYRHALTQVQLSGPTLFAHIIRYAAAAADQSWMSSRTYSILLIITDGVINDMDDTIDAIVEAGAKPLSIIIVGVGTANFSAMEVLDADDRPLVSRRGQKMVRDIVQFVPFRQFANKHYSMLASEVLAEVPQQFIDWANLHRILPT